MKRMISLFMICACLISLCACGASEVETVTVEPDIQQIKNICNIATLECYYHNVGEMKKEKGTGWAHILEKNQKCWIEYSGMVTLGVDGSKIEMEIEGSNIVITMPKAEILRIGYDENQDFKMYSSKQLINFNEITADEKSQILKTAQENMKIVSLENGNLTQIAIERAKEIISNYVDGLSKLSKKNYQIIWKDVE